MPQWPALVLLVIVTVTVLANGQDDPMGEELWLDVRDLLDREIRDQLLVDELEAEQFLSEVNEGCLHYNNRVAEYSFRYETNVTKENSDKLAAISLENSNWIDNIVQRAKQFNTDRLNSDMQRQFELIKQTTNPRDERVRKKLDVYGNELVKIYSSAKACNDTKCYAGETDLVSLYANTSTDYYTLLWAWKEWRAATGPKMKDLYTKLVDLMNTGARDNGYRDLSVPWMMYEMDDPHLNRTALRIWEKVKPLYDELHAYVRFNLMKRFPGKIQPDGPIPEHLLGNVWGQEWGHVYTLMEPYPEVPLRDVTNKMKQRGYTVRKIFTTAESFFTSLGLDKMTDKFWEKSMFKDPNDGRTVQCHASASDFFDKEKRDFRIKMCTVVNEFDMMTVHHEMGHIEYYMQYRDQPCVYRTGANAAFHEAVGDTIQLSVMTPEHLQKIGLATDSDLSGNEEKQYKQSINFLLRMALNKVAFLPYGLLIDFWRWSVFSGRTPPQRYNHDWWQFRVGIGGVMPPIDRSERDFDPGSKYHVASNTRYIRYFFSFLLQFQFHKSLCEIKGYRGPIHLCDIHGSIEAGDKLREMLRLGKSRPWPDALEILTGQREVDPTAMLDYFQPLHDWLKRTNRKNGAKPGWKTRNVGVTW